MSTTAESSSTVRRGQGRGPGLVAAAGREAAVRGRRRPWLWVAGVLLVAVGGLGAAALVGRAGDRVEVLAVARPVPVGQTISVRDLSVARVAADPALRPVPVLERSRVLGRTAAVDLRPGTLLTADAVTDAPVPAEGEQLVGVAVPPGRMPARGVRAGDQVLVVPVPGDQASAGDTTGPAAGEPIRARVVQVGPPDVEGVSTVDVVVGAAVGQRLAILASAGRVTLVLLPAGGR